MFIRTQTNADRTYLLLVENERVAGRVQQKIIARLGRLDELISSGELDRLLKSLGRFSAGQRLRAQPTMPVGKNTTITTIKSPSATRCQPNR